MNIELLREKIEHHAEELTKQIENGEVEHKIDEVYIPKIEIESSEEFYNMTILVGNKVAGMKLKKSEWDKASDRAFDYLARTLVYESTIQLQQEKKDE